MFTCKAGTEDGDYLCMFNKKSCGALNVYNASDKDILNATSSLVDNSLEYKH